MTATQPPATALAQQQPATPQVAKKPIDTFRKLLDMMRPQLSMALPKHVDIDRMVRICLTTVQRTPKLLDCTRESLLSCIVQCAQLGLEPDGLLGHAYLIPFNNRRQINGQWKSVLECTLIVGYKGLLKLARQSGEIASISARVVHKADKFEYSYGLVETLIHVPSDEEDPGPVTHAYAIFRLKDGSHHFDVMTAREIDRIRDKSKGYQAEKEKSPWTTSYDEMAKKTVLRRASKMSPASIEDKTARAIAMDERADEGLPQDLDVELPALPAEDVPGADQQGQRLSLSGGKTHDVAVAAVATDDSSDTGEPPHDPATGEVVTDGAAAAEGQGGESQIRPRKEPTKADMKALIKAATEARVPLADVVKKYGVASVPEMDADDVRRETTDLVEMAKVS